MKVMTKKILHSLVSKVLGQEHREWHCKDYDIFTRQYRLKTDDKTFFSSYIWLVLNYFYNYFHYLYEKNRNQLHKEEEKQTDNFASQKCYKKLHCFWKKELKELLCSQFDWQVRTVLFNRNRKTSKTLVVRRCRDLCELDMWI